MPGPAATKRSKISPRPPWSLPRASRAAQPASVPIIQTMPAMRANLRMGRDYDQSAQRSPWRVDRTAHPVLASPHVRKIHPDDELARGGRLFGSPGRDRRRGRDRHAHAAGARHHAGRRRAAQSRANALGHGRAEREGSHERHEAHSRARRDDRHAADLPRRLRASPRAHRALHLQRSAKKSRRPNASSR